MAISHSPSLASPVLPNGLMNKEAMMAGMEAMNWAQQYGLPLIKTENLTGSASIE